MSEIGILTASRTDNNGTDLQCMAMLMLINKLTKSVELIDYRCNRLEKTRTIFKFNTVSSLFSIPFRLYDHLQREKFRKKYFNYSIVSYTQNNLFTNSYNTIVVGSDQVWNSSITGNDTGFYLPYANKYQLKYSYAVSFGNQNIKLLDKKVMDYLGDFNCVSVREITNVSRLKEKGIDARYDLDPLLMITSHEWNMYTRKINYKQKYILVYITEYNEKTFDLAKCIADKKHLNVICIGGTNRFIHGIRNIRFCSIKTWLTYLKNAEIVITNSYHCLSFAINYHRKFVLTNRFSDPNDTRFSDLLSLIGITDYKTCDIYECDWNSVDKILEEKRNNSYKYLYQIVRGSTNVEKN